MPRPPLPGAAVAMLGVACVGLVCRYTVRDVAFADLGDAPYRLVAFVAEADTPGAGETLEHLAAAMLVHTNVTVERTDPDDELTSEQDGWLAAARVQSFPYAVLVAADGRSCPVALGSADRPIDAAAIEALVSSPARDAILERLLHHIALPVLIECGDTAADRAASDAIDRARDGLASIFDAMPKAVGDLPETVRITAEQRDDERVLLLGLDVPVDLDTPAVAVVFGRGRRIGPPLIGARITPEALFPLLANAGRSCECDLDRSWMRGPRFPMRWDADMRQAAVDVLGFDPDNPLVLSEISSLIGKKRRADPDLLGYREFVVGPDGSQRQPTLDELVATFEAEPGRAPTDATADATATRSTDGETPPTSGVILALGVVAGLGLLVTAWIFAARGRS